MKPVFLALLLSTTTLFGQTLEEKVARLVTLSHTEFNSSNLEGQRDTQLKALQSMVKDEFETQAEFEKRKSEAEGKGNALSADFAQRIAEAKKVFAARKEEIKTELNGLLTQSLADVSSGITIGTYNAETNTFPVTLTVSSQTLDVNVPREVARDFKAQVGSVLAKGKKQYNEKLTWEYFNWNITVPGGQTYAFGEQRGVQAQVAQLQSTPPPALLATVAFKEPSGNNAMDAEEKASLAVTVTNNGKGAALGLEAKVVPEHAKGISLSPTLFVGEVAAGATRTVPLELSSNDQTVDGKATFTFSFTEARGFPPDPVKVTIDTRALVPPKFVVADVGVREPSGNGKIENEEVVGVTTRIQNIGNGNAHGVKVSFDLGENVTKMPESQSSFTVGDLAAGAFYDAIITIYTNKVATEIPVFVTVTEPSGRYDIKHQRLTQLQLNQRVQQLHEVVIAGKETEKRQISIAGGLSVDVDMNIPSATKKNPDAVALVVGISRYKNPNVPTVDYAKHGAAVMKEYLVKEMGFSEERILYAEDENAGRNDFNILFQKLSNFVKPGKSDVFVYYNGHGAPDTKSNEAFFVPYDCDPEYAGVSGYPVTEFYNRIANLPARSVTVVLDACFSGSTPKGLLFKGVSPALLKVKNPIAAIPNGVVLSSSSENQLSNWLPDKQHGLFTYYFLKGLQGAADANGDKKITAGEMEQYLNSVIPDKARELNREQTPTVVGNKDAVIATYEDK